MISNKESELEIFVKNLSFEKKMPGKEGEMDRTKRLEFYQKLGFIKKNMLRGAPERFSRDDFGKEINLKGKGFFGLGT